MPRDNTNLIVVESVSKSFASNSRRTPVLAQVSFAVERGKIACVVGPSGSGKTTLLRLLSGLIPVDDGNISVFGNDPTEARRGHSFAFVFQSPALLPWSNVIENVSLPSKVSKRTGMQPMDALRLVGLEGFARSYPHELSGGMRQRASLARALTIRPDILLLDEPFNSLDERSREDLEDLVLELNGRFPELTVVAVTHDLYEAAYLADQVIVLSERPAHVKGILPLAHPEGRGPHLRDTAALAADAQRIRACLA